MEATRFLLAGNDTREHKLRRPLVAHSMDRTGRAEIAARRARADPVEPARAAH